MTFELYPADRKAEAHELFLDWWMQEYFYSEESRSFAQRDDTDLDEIVSQGLVVGVDLKAAMAGRVATEVLRLRQEMTGLTPQELSLRERLIRATAQARDRTLTPGEHVECEVAFALFCASEYELTEADWDAEDAAVAARLREGGDDVSS